MFEPKHGTNAISYKFNCNTTNICIFRLIQINIRTFIYNSTQDTQPVLQNSRGQMIATIKDTSFLTISKQEKFLSKLKIENVKSSLLDIQCRFLLPTRGPGLCKSCFWLCLEGKKGKTTFNVYRSILHIQFRLLHIYITPWNIKFEPFLSGVKNRFSCIFSWEHYVTNTSSILPVQYRSGCLQETNYSC